ncbi:MAG: methyltransferase domain-containing protein [Polyangiales bacterium]
MAFLMARLNAIELEAMQSPLRRLLQRKLELPTFGRMLEEAGIDLKNRRILDAGCGSGYGMVLLRSRYWPSRLVGFDLMPEQIERARARGIHGAEIRVGDITRIEEPEASFDAVFVFGILHHVPEWRTALSEIARVLAPGGVLLVEEIHGRGARLEDRLLGTEHPREAMFDWPTFREGLSRAGLTVVAERRLAWEFARSFLARKTEIV